MNSLDRIIAAMCPDAKERDAVARILGAKRGLYMEPPSVQRRAVYGAKRKAAKEKKP